jgi:hypothetical protein
VIKSALPQAALALVAKTIAMRIGAGGSHRGEGTGDKGKQNRNNDEALHMAFPWDMLAIDSFRSNRSW